MKSTGICGGNKSISSPFVCHTTLKPVSRGPPETARCWKAYFSPSPLPLSSVRSSCQNDPGGRIQKLRHRAERQVSGPEAMVGRLLRVHVRRHAHDWRLWMHLAGETPTNQPACLIQGHLRRLVRVKGGTFRHGARRCGEDILFFSPVVWRECQSNTSVIWPPNQTKTKMENPPPHPHSYKWTLSCWLVQE